MSDEADTDVRDQMVSEDIKSLARIALGALDALTIIAALARDEAFQAVVEDLNDSLKPILKWAARYGYWEGWEEP